MNLDEMKEVISEYKKAIKIIVTVEVMDIEDEHKGFDIDKAEFYNLSIDEENLSYILEIYSNGEKDEVFKIKHPTNSIRHTLERYEGDNYYKKMVDERAENLTIRGV